MYTVFDTQGDFEFDDAEAGLSLAEAAHFKLVRNGYSYELRRMNDTMVLLGEKRRSFPVTVSHLVPMGASSAAADDLEACQDIMRQVIGDTLPMGGSYSVMTDEKYRDARERFERGESAEASESNVIPLAPRGAP